MEPKTKMDLEKLIMEPLKNLGIDQEKVKLNANGLDHWMYLAKVTKQSKVPLKWNWHLYPDRRHFQAFQVFSSLY